MSDDAEADVVDVLSDDYMWTILERTREEPQSVDALSDACEADPSTIYRRIERLQAADLLEAQQKLDPGGHHYKVYSARLQEVRIRLDDDGFDVDVDRTPTESAADRFTRLYEGFK
ncbi:ArsR family transcriptional regulator [Salinadaptatus halalkaliphilus]|uniref:ArsR family transcriptional regulator n=1 Tax=Salinadaptatus halalkaliphilus TaxID=2419781 RepID=A0A4S3TK07_9EURY|nr:helix-turn-helix domain-containing protein [Salinadaptatus halalkaliphilus]THE63900.1 ArsR family transcriptional regulator [Salinadaptatus halalkaliphilus]